MKRQITHIRIDRLPDSEQRGQVHLIAKAVVTSEHGVRQTLRSAGHLVTVGTDHPDVTQTQLTGLRDELRSFGFGERAIAHAFKTSKL